ncbi:class I mannose-6-phosphate isomerase [Sphingorhabdus sp.]|jgi:mannose-6-phosphate isomerase|uniref:class I mannose-6-phosphate isomerase n=1 Tax=Sphingorhabdus sp. TaxID=1902408 RepID=UPI0037C53152
MKLDKHFVEKPWGRIDVPAAFGDLGGRQIGEIWYEAPDGAPLPILVKWLFTSEKLSIQVHPSDAQAQQRGLPSGKEECWYIVDAEPGAVLGMGTLQPMSADELRAASLSGEIEQLMDWKPVQPGDFFYIPAGTVHAIGAGITLVEVQQYADITYRLYDYGRPRELHLDDGVAVSKATSYADARSGRAEGNMRLVDGPFFELDHVNSTSALARINGDGPFWVIPIKGETQIGGVAAGPGECLLLESLAPVVPGPNATLLVARAADY